MTLNKLFSLFFLSGIYFLLSGGSILLESPGSLLLYCLGVLYIFCMLYTDLIFSIFDGDVVTYGGAIKGITLWIGTPALLFIATLVRVNSNLVQIPQWLSNILYAFVFLGLLIIFSVPIMSSNSPAPLASRDQQRCYDETGIVKDEEEPSDA